MYLFLEQKDLVFLERWVPLFVSIFFLTLSEFKTLTGLKKRISTAIGAKRNYSASLDFFISSKVFFNLVGIISNGSFTNHNTYKVEKNLAGQQQRIILKI
jgi:hypothetical protein